ncbi:MAG: helix-turn-helix domain-containing protein [Prevotella sp.]|nr:helix-turn-helix domain-containing protein [Prevotella sp.]
MTETYKLPTSVASFSEIIDSITGGQAVPGEDSIATADYFISTGCKSFFKPIEELRLPMRMDCVRFGIIKQGWSDPVINLHRYHCAPGDMLFANWGAVLDSDVFAPGTEVEGFILREEYVKLLYNGKLPSMFVKSSQCFHMRLTDEEKQTCDRYLQMLVELIHLSDGKSHDAIASLFKSAIDFAQSLFDRDQVVIRDYWPRSKRIAEAFMQLVSEHARRQHDLGFYASELCLSPHRLSVAVKEKTGESAKAWIDKTLTIEIQVELRHTDKSLKQLASEFRFSSLSSFCKFFKRNVGMTAVEYRMRQ